MEMEMRREVDEGRLQKIFRIQIPGLNDSVRGCERISIQLFIRYGLVGGAFRRIILVSLRSVQHNRMFCHVIPSETASFC